MAEIYQNFGVETHYNENSVRLVKVNDTLTKELNFHLSDAPDIAQTIAVTAFGLGKACEMTGLHTLKIKETDRLVALKTELEKLGAHVTITDESLSLKFLIVLLMMSQLPPTKIIVWQWHLHLLD